MTELYHVGQCPGCRQGWLILQRNLSNQGIYAHCEECELGFISPGDLVPPLNGFLTIRPIALNRKNALFAGHHAGAENWATIASLIETCKLNAIDPQAYLTATLNAIVNGHKQSRIDELLPWNYPLE